MELSQWAGMEGQHGDPGRQLQEEEWQWQVAESVQEPSLLPQPEVHKHLIQNSHNLLPLFVLHVYLLFSLPSPVHPNPRRPCFWFSPWLQSTVSSRWAPCFPSPCLRRSLCRMELIVFISDWPWLQGKMQKWVGINTCKRSAWSIEEKGASGQSV